MKKTILTTAILSLCLATAGAAFAQDHNDDHRGDQQQGHGGGDYHQGQPQQQNHGDQHYEGRNDRESYQPHDNHGGPRGAGPRHDMQRGGRLPQEYRSNQYVVNDWQGHHLNRPPRGQHWVQTGNDYVLVGIATGVIASILLNN